MRVIRHLLRRLFDYDYNKLSNDIGHALARAQMAEGNVSSLERILEAARDAGDTGMATIFEGELLEARARLHGDLDAVRRLRAIRAKL